MITTTPKLTTTGELGPPVSVALRTGSTRRKFLLHCSTIAAAAAMGPMVLTAEASLPEMKDISLDDLRFSTFAKQAKTRFRVQAGPNRTVELELSEATLAKAKRVKAGQPPPGDAGNERFSLLFTGPREELLQQRIYAFEHDRIGRFEMFITPIVPRDPGRYYYQAIFNRPIKSKAAKT